MRKEIIGDATLYLGDCLEILPTLGSVDAVITDPPFAFAGGLSNGRSSQIDNQFFAHWWASVCRQLERILKSDAEGFIWCDWKTVSAIAEGFKPIKQTYDFFRISQVIYHYREMPGMGRPFRSSVDLLAYLRGPKSKGHRIRNDTQNWISKYWYYGKHEYHPAEKDVGICEQLIKWCSDESDIILDSFMGSGTTGIACINLNRHFIGIEDKLHHFDTACKRIELAYQQPRLFEKQREKINQLDLIS